MNSSFALRPEIEADATFRRILFRQSKGAALSELPLPPDMLERILEQQFNAQTQGYRATYPAGRFEIIEMDQVPVGRLATHRGPQSLHLIDIALLADRRGRGVGGAILGALMDEARALSLPMTLHVDRDNLAAQRLYQRLGFVLASADETYLGLRWPAAE